MARFNLTRRSLLGGLAASACVARPWRAAAQGEGPKGNPAEPQAIQVNARALPHFHPGRPGTKRFGNLEYRGGVVLSSPSTSFCEWSGLVIDGNGKRLLAVSDVGSWMSADVTYSEEGAPTGLARALIGPLLDQHGRPLDDKRDRDAESIALVDGSTERGTFLIGFEREHRIGRFEVRNGHVLAPTAHLQLPPDADRLLPNAGFEAVAVLQAGPLKGSPVAFAERLPGGDGYHTGWIWVEGQPRRILLRDIDGFDITDAAGLPDGGLLILERYFRMGADGRKDQRMRIRRLQAKELESGARMTGHTVAEADSDYEIDNMEGLAVHAGASGETVVTLLSDDNLNPAQRTLFLQFTLRA
jgi:hypothetical protein